MFLIPFEPKPQSRPRATIRGRHAAVYEDPKMMKWRKQVTDYIKENYDGVFYDLPLKLDVTFYMRAPKSLSEPPKPRSKQKKKDEYANFITEKFHTIRKLIWII